MQCPDCGYMMTALEKECPRCARMGRSARPGPASPPPLGALPQDRPLADPFLTPSEPVADVPAAFPVVRRPPINLTAVACAVALMIALVALAITVASQRHAEAVRQQAAADQQQEKQAALLVMRREGFGQCTAGDAEGCHYYMDKLRDAGHPDDAEFLKANMIFSQFLAGNVFLAASQREFSRDGGLSRNETEAAGTLAATQGDTAAMDAAEYLAKPTPPAFASFVHVAADQSAPPPAPAPVAAAPPVTPAAPSSGTGFTMRTEAGGGPPPDTKGFRSPPSPPAPISGMTN